MDGEPAAPDGGSPSTGEPPVGTDWVTAREAAEELFGPALPGAREFAALLCGVGVDRGLLGPREATRVWDRHLLNSAVIAPLVPQGSRVVDLGSGAGLPGIPLALVRSDLCVVLVDSALRRTTFLTEAVALLGLGDRVSVVRARAEEIRRSDDVVVARAVAPLDRLAGWSAGLVRRGGLVLALRGEEAATELSTAAAALSRAGWHDAEIVTISSPGTSDVRVMRAHRR